MSLKWICFCIFGCLCLAVAPFLNLPILETNTTFIASYGAYLSGTIVPLIALFAFWGILKTLKLQQDQIKLLSNDSKKQEIVRYLEKLESLIKQELSNHPITINVSEKKYTLYQVMTMDYFGTTFQNVVKSHDEYSKLNLNPNDLIILESILSTGVCVTRISEYLFAYRKLSNSNCISNFYGHKYKNLANRLYHLGYIDKEKHQFWE